MSLHSTDEELSEELRSVQENATVQYFLSGSTTLRYVHIPNASESAPVLLTLHGAPGSCSDFSSYWAKDAITKKFEVISIDRPGYGGSSDPEINMEIEEQANCIVGLLTYVANEKKVVIFSHSYGGPIGAKIAVQLDTSCLGHVMVAPVIDPISEKVFWYSPIPIILPFSWFSSSDWKSAAREKKTHIDQLKALTPSWQSINSKTIHIHGTSDWLAPIDNISFCKAHFNNAFYEPIIIEEGSHFILWESDIQKMIVEHLLLL